MNLVNLGKWILRFLFDKLIQEEIKRDDTVREKLEVNLSRPESLHRGNAPTSIQLPSSHVQASPELMSEDDSIITPRATANGFIRPAQTPGLVIGSATPHLNGNNSASQSDRPSPAEEGIPLEKRTSQHSQPRSSTDRKSDYFSPFAQGGSPIDAQSKGSVTPGDKLLEGTTSTSTQSPADGDKDEKSKDGGRFGKSFRMKFPKKLGRSSNEVRPAVLDEKSEESDKSEDRGDRTVQENFLGVVQRIRYDYEERFQIDAPSYLPSGITPSLLNETPRLHLPPYTAVIIQDERLDSGGVADLYRGTVTSVGYDTDIIERVAPMWLGELLLKASSLLPCMFLTESPRIKCPPRKYLKSRSSYFPTKTFCPASQVLMGKSIHSRFSFSDPLTHSQKFTIECKPHVASKEDTCLCR